jgi:hypothetical protein
MKKLLVFLTYAVLALVVAGLLLFSTDILTRTATSVTVSALRSESVLQLCTDTVATQVVVTEETKNILLGQDRAVIIAPVKLTYGFDLSQLTSSDIVSKKDGPVVHLRITFPEMELLHREVLWDKAQVFQKGNLLMVLKNRISNRNLVADAQKKLAGEAERFAEEMGLKPGREQTLQRIENYLEGFPWISLFEATGVLDIELR